MEGNKICSWHPKNERSLQQEWDYGDRQSRNGWDQVRCIHCDHYFWPWEFGEMPSENSQHEPTT